MGLENKLLYGDCLRVMKKIPDKSIDVVITDPPYGTTQCKWDSIIPLDLMWKQLERIIKLNGAIILFGSEPFSSYLRLSNLKMFKYDWIWNRKRVSGFLNAKKRPLVQHEIISVFYKKQPLYNFQLHNNKLYRDFVGHIQREDKTEVYGKQKEYISDVSPDKSFPRSVLEITAVIGNSGEKLFHPTQKPVALMDYLIKTYTNENEVVLDFAAGSGTTAIAAMVSNRKYICIEKDFKIYKLAKLRIESFKYANRK